MDKQDKLFDIPIKTAPRWKFWLARIFGKTIYKKDKIMAKDWRGDIWCFPPVYRRNK